MRQVFSSARLENVEAVAELLRAEGIEVRISDGRSYRGNRRSNFSYSEAGQSGPLPAVWILNAEDQPRGRQLLRDAGLLESTRAGESSYLSLSTMHEARDSTKRKANTRTRMRIGLLVLIVVVSALIWYSRLEAPTATTPASKRAVAAVPSAPKHAAPAIIPQLAEDLEVYRADIPTALAKLLIENEITKAKPAQACIAIDGADPTPQFIESLALGDATEAFSSSDCPQDAAWNVAVHDYMTDGLGRGHVQVESGGGKPRTVEAERNGIRWKILSKR
ncbi:hypothetical protein [Thermomonas sp.]|uniref:hypothetical protein n=1 Tax=Thermomonas sp. TaxID=1971895 RepID=UPI002489CC95|nr:hypothetical protein [Thermomonas sp.]MDI1251959.1 hypothetical protein [Thermomonas sp.]